LILFARRHNRARRVARTLSLAVVDRIEAVVIANCESRS
jgi:hypothetical protein